MPRRPGRATQLYLGSASPRRRALLSQVGIRFAVVPTDVPERRRAGESPREMASRLACEKAMAAHAIAGRRGYPVRPVLGADTIVVLDGESLGKPSDQDHARAMLRRLGGRTHEVITALALLSGEEVHRALSRSRVTFKPLSRDEIDAYCATGEPVDKAGAYAIQGRGGLLVRRLEGSYSGVVGLPLFELHQLLRHAGISPL